MKLIVEKHDISVMKPGTYDVSDMGVARIAMLPKVAGAHEQFEVKIDLDTSMKPEPGTVGDPHFKFGITCEENKLNGTQDLVAFGRPEPDSGAGYAYREPIRNSDLSNLQNPDALVEERARRALEAVANQVIATLVKHAICDVLQTTKVKKIATGAKKSDEQARLGQFFGIPSKSKSGTCDECAGTGEYVSPMTGVTSPCSKGCAKP